MVNDRNWEIVIFTTDDDLIRLSRRIFLYMDGTFRSSQRPYSQVYIYFFTVNVRMGIKNFLQH